MRKAAFLLTAGLLLAGCGGTTQAATPTTTDPKPAYRAQVIEIIDRAIASTAPKAGDSWLQASLELAKLTPPPERVSYHGVITKEVEYIFEDAAKADEECSRELTNTLREAAGLTATGTTNCTSLRMTLSQRAHSSRQSIAAAL
jgi:hypothetical protein